MVYHAFSSPCEPPVNFSLTVCRCHHPDHDHHCNVHSHLMICLILCWRLGSLFPSVLCCAHCVCDLLLLKAHLSLQHLCTLSFKLCPLSPRQQTDQWEWMVWMWLDLDLLTWSSHSPSRRERSQVTWKTKEVWNLSFIMISVELLWQTAFLFFF